MKKVVLEKIKLSQIGCKFIHPPLLVSGMAMMYHGLRESTKDIDFIVHPDDYLGLVSFFGDKAVVLKEKHHAGFKEKPLLVDLYGDLGVLFHEFEIWKTIMLYGYEELSPNAIKEKDFIVISLEKLMFLSTLRGAYKERYLSDAILIAKKICDERYAKK